MTIWRSVTPSTSWLTHWDSDMADYGELADRLTAVGADIDEIAFDALREAVADGEVQRPVEDKKLMQARRAIEKAAGILRQLDGDSADGW